MGQKSSSLTVPLLGGEAAAAEGAEPLLKPVEQFSWFSQFFFIYMTPVFNRAVANGRLTFKDIHTAGMSNDPVAAFRRFLSRFGLTASLISIHNQYWPRWWYGGALLLVSNVGTLATPYIIQHMLAFLDSEEAQTSSWQGYAWAGGIFAASAISAATIHKFWWEATRVGLHSQFSFTSLLMLKSLQLSAAARSTATRGKLVNHLTTDACRCCDQFVYCSLHWQTWSAGITIGLAIYSLWSLLGVAGLVGAGALVLFVPAISVLTRLTRRFSERVQARRDARGRLVTELIAGIQTLKTFGWADWFLQKIYAARLQEMRAIRSRQMLGVATDVLSISCPILILAGTFALYTWLNPHTPLSAATAFSVVNWVTVLQFPLRSVPYVIVTLVDCNTSLDRLRKLFAAEDVDVSAMQQWVDAIERNSGHRDGVAPPAVVHSDAAQAEVPMRGWLRAEDILTVEEEEERGRLAGAGCCGGAATAVPPRHGRGAATAASAGSYAARDSPDTPPIILAAACFAWPPAAPEGDEKSTEPDATLGGAGGAASGSGDAGSRAHCRLCSDAGESGRELPSVQSGQAADEGGLAASAFTPALHGLDVRCDAGSISLLAGVVGSGKSTLLSGLIGEAKRLCGRARVTGSMAYCSQVPWILNRTFRDNVTFTSPYDPEWYATVVSACALDRDVASFQNGHDTMIGDAGITLSGGQKHRVALARAVYADADVYLIDDVLGAVDAVVAAHLWDSCIVRLLQARGKTVLLATHAVHFAARREVSQVVVLNSAGRIAASGPFAVVSRDPIASRVLATEGTAESRRQRSDDSETLSAGKAGSAAVSPLPSAGVVPGAPSAAADSAASSSAVASEGDTAGSAAASAPATAAATDAGAGATGKAVGGGGGGAAQEGMEAYATGAVQARHVLRYVRSMGSPLFLAFLLSLYVASQGVTIAIAWWMALWVGAQPTSSSSAPVTAAAVGIATFHGEPAPPPQPGAFVARALAAIDVSHGSAAWYAIIYAGLNVGLAVLTLLRSVSLNYASLHAASKLHDEAITAVAHAAASFFATNPAGRILNRFLSDQGTIDDTVRLSISQMALLIFGLMGTISVISVFAPYTLILVAVLAVLYYYLARGYRYAARDLRRMQSVAKSPIISSYAETLRGLATIRAFGPKTATAFLERHLHLTREYGRAFLSYWSANEFISTWLEGIGCLVILGACTLAVWEHGRGQLSTASVGLLLTFVLQVPSSCMWLIRYAVQIQVDTVSLERIAEYAALEDEEVACALPRVHGLAAEGTAAAAAAGGAAVEGGVAFRDVDMRYGPQLPQVLRGFTLAIPPGAKIAIW